MPSTPTTYTSTSDLAKSQVAADSAKKVALQDSLFKKQKSDSLAGIQPIVSVMVPYEGKTIDSPALYAFSIAGYGSPELYMNRIKSYSGPYDVKSEKTNPRLNTGARFGICFKDKLEVSLGCAYSQISQEFHPETLFFPKTISQPKVFNSSLGDMVVPVSTMLSSFNMLAPVPDFKCEYQYSQTVQFLNVPLTARFNFGKGRFKGYVNTGVNIQYAFSQHGTLELLKENETDRLDYNSLDVRKINYAVMLGGGLEFRMVKHLSVFLEPNARLNLLPVTNGTTVQSSASYIGAAAGIKWNR
jgi:hypothetical protein